MSALKKKKVKESQSHSVTPSLDTPSGAGLGVSHDLTDDEFDLVLTFNPGFEFSA